MHSIYQQVAYIFLGITWWSLFRQVVAICTKDQAANKVHRLRAFLFSVYAVVLLVINHVVSLS